MTYEVDATTFKKRSGEFIDRALKGEVVIKRRNRPVAVLVDFERYQSLKKRLEELEDLLLALKAEEILKNAEFVELNPKELKNGL